MLNKIRYTVLGIIIALIFFPHASKEQRIQKESRVLGTAIQKPLKINISPEFAGNLSPPDLSAKAALAFDPNSDSILYVLNFDDQLPIASLTKLMTALVVRNSVSLDASVVVRKADTKVVGNSLGLVASETVRVLDLLRALLISSSNDAALALASYVAGSTDKFVELMNQQAAQLNLNATHFGNPAGWDSDDSYSSTRDLAKLVKVFLKDPVLSEIVSVKETEIFSLDRKYSHKLTSTNKLLLDDPSILGIKTGFTSKALGNLIIRAKRGQAEVVTIVLGSQNREEDTKKLLDWIFKVYRW